MLINKRLEEPYNKLPKEGDLPILSKPLINSQLSDKFWKKAKQILENNTNINNNIKENSSAKNIVNNESKYNIKNKNLNIKNKRSKTPLLKNINYRKNKNQINFNNSNIINNNNFNLENYNYNFENNNNINENNKYNFEINNDNNSNYNNIEYNNINNNYIIQNNDNNYKNINIDHIELNALKETADKLEQDLIKKEKIISQQRQERVKLLKRIESLEQMISSLISMDNL